MTTENMIAKWTKVIILLLVLISVAAVVIPEFADAGDTMNATGLPLSGLFASDSVAPLIVMAGLIIAVLVGAFALGKGKR